MVFSKVKSGAESVVINIINNIDKSKFDVYVITNEELVNSLQVDELNILNIGNLYENNLSKKIQKKLFGSEKVLINQVNKKKQDIENYILKKGIQVVHSHLPIDTYITSILSSEKLKKIMTIHGAYNLDYRDKKTIFSSKFISKMYNEADLVTSSCDYFIDVLENQGAKLENYVIVENGIDFNILKAKSIPEINDSKLNMVYLGGTRNIKGWDILLEALKIVIKDYNYNKIHIDILRDIPLDSQLYITAKEYDLLDYITFRGYVSNNDHLKYMAKSNLYLLPSYSEGIANTLVEAIGLGKCVLATKVGGTPELIKHLENGYLCETNGKSLAEGIVYFIEKKDKLREFSDNNVKIAKDLSWEKIIKKYESEYLKLI
jgi:glycosyltransferase involved in cell wall biosynthesis